MYAKIEDGKIIAGPQALPRSTKSISGFNLQSDAKLKKHGWLPVVDLSAKCDPTKQKISRWTPKIEADQVVRTPIVSDLTTDELVALKKAELIAVADADLELQAIAAVGG